MKFMKNAIILLALCLHMKALADTNSGTTGALFLKHHFSPRAEAMAEAFTAVADDAQAAYWNPAGLARLSRDEISTSFSKGIFDDYFSQVTYARQTQPQLAMAGGFAYYDGGNFDLVDDEGRAERMIAQRDYLISLAAGYRLDSAWNVGLTANGLYSTLLNASGLTGALNLGAIYQPGWLPALRAGLVVKNMGPDLGYGGAKDPLPVCGQLGIAYRLLPGRATGVRHDLVGAIDINAGLDIPVYVNLGAEYWFARTLAVRAGYKFNRSLEGLTMGLGIRFPLAEDRLQMDYALGFAAGVDGIHKLAVSYIFTPSQLPNQDSMISAAKAPAYGKSSSGNGQIGLKKPLCLTVLEVEKDQKTVKRLILGSGSKTPGVRSGIRGIIFNPGRLAAGRCSVREVYPARCVADVLSLAEEIKPGAHVETEED